MTAAGMVVAVLAGKPTGVGLGNGRFADFVGVSTPIAIPS